MIALASAAPKKVGLVELVIRSESVSGSIELPESLPASSPWVELDKAGAVVNGALAAPNETGGASVSMTSWIETGAPTSLNGAPGVAGAGLTVDEGLSISISASIL